jgi:hypothetical protein
MLLVARYGIVTERALAGKEKPPFGLGLGLAN